MLRIAPGQGQCDDKSSTIEAEPASSSARVEHLLSAVGRTEEQSQTTEVEQVEDTRASGVSHRHASMDRNGPLEVAQPPVLGTAPAAEVSGDAARDPACLNRLAMIMPDFNIMDSRGPISLLNCVVAPVW